MLLMPKAAEGIKAFFDWAALPVYLLMGQSMGMYPGLAWNVPSWSIAAEWWTYVAAIFIFPVLNAGKNYRTWIAMGVSVFGLWLLITLHETHSLNITYDFGILRCLFEFVIGIGLYQLYRARTWEGLLSSTIGFMIAVVLALLVLHSPISDLWILPAFSLLILCTAYNRGTVQRLLNTRPLQFLGDISYSVYMMQALWLFMFWALFGAYKTENNIQDIALEMKLIWLFGLLLVNILSAALTYHYIEIPSREKLRKAMARSYTPTPEKV
jgi:peptidoglycan/LPS O-acetylase OafA/YrhL